MKINLPEALKKDLPITFWGKILGVTPIVMTVVATLLAGLASSEMTRAQYDRSWAAQMQSKAGDQWNFFQGKKLRGVIQLSTLDLMSGNLALHPLSSANVSAALASTPAAAALQTEAGRQALLALTTARLPKKADAPPFDPAVHAALKALEESRPEAELVQLLAQTDDRKLAEAVRSAQEHALAFDTLLKPLGQVIELAEQHLAAPEAVSELRRSFVAARLRYHAMRYDTEARLNQTVATLFELQVRKGNLSAERHHRRSQKFFFGMLAAQMGVIVSTLAMAARQRNLLWAVAATAGAVAISFAVYVYLFV